MANNVEARLEYANSSSLSYKQFLELLCEDEYSNRQDNNYKMRLLRAKLPSVKRIEDFDFSFQPSIDKREINDAVTCDFIARKKNIIFIGSPGVGKTHLSISLALKALTHGYRVLFTSVSEMLYKLHISKADNSYYKKLNEYIKPDLLVLDELGFKRLPDYAASDFFDVISKRYETGSSIITTNKTTDLWSEIFTDNVMANAIQDRLMHHSKVFKVTGASYRSKNIKDAKNSKYEKTQKDECKQEEVASIAGTDKEASGTIMTPKNLKADSA
jgi:DNA replication protein DnaC